MIKTALRIVLRITLLITPAGRPAPRTLNPPRRARLKDLVLKWMPVSHNKALDGESPEEGERQALGEGGGRRCNPTRPLVLLWG